jgi:hypothetical protein
MGACVGLVFRGGFWLTEPPFRMFLLRLCDYMALEQALEFECDL